MLTKSAYLALPLPVACGGKHRGQPNKYLIHTASLYAGLFVLQLIYLT